MPTGPQVDSDEDTPEERETREPPPPPGQRRDPWPSPSQGPLGGRCAWLTQTSPSHFRFCLWETGLEQAGTTLGVCCVRNADTLPCTFGKNEEKHVFRLRFLFLHRLFLASPFPHSLFKKHVLQGGHRPIWTQRGRAQRVCNPRGGQIKPPSSDTVSSQGD